MISWHAVALHFADRGSACALLDGASRIRLFSAGLENLLGWDRERVEGRPWVEAIAPPDFVATAQARIERALAGTVRAFECEAATPKGERFKLALDAALVGRESEQGLLLTVSSAQPVTEDSELSRSDDIEYEIASSVSDFGRVLRMKTPTGSARTVFAPTDRCFTLIHGQCTPCDDCPVLQQGNNLWPRTAARAARGSGEHAYEVVTAEGCEDRVRVRLRRISAQTLGAIHESKVRALADAAQLSERERTVLTYLLMGRSLADIALILDISPRTVKFHQANVLEKLGADSRADLVRLIT